MEKVISRSNDTTDLTKIPRADLIRRIRQLENECNILKIQKKSNVSSKFVKIRDKKYRSDRKIDKRQRQISFDYQRKIALKVSYLGWDLDGFQENAGLQDSIESLVFQSLVKSKLVPPESTRNDWDYSKCGRTDKAVSAFEQVMCFKVRSILPQFKVLNVNGTENLEEAVTNEQICDMETNARDTLKSRIVFEDEQSLEADDNELDYPKMLNSFLPQEVKVLAWSPIDDDFNARFDCTQREYRYMFPKGKFDIEKMKEGAKNLEGHHDYRNFCKLNVQERTNHVRFIYKCYIEKLDSQSVTDCEDDLYQAVIIGNGFLYHQVRYTMSILFFIGLGKEDPSIISKLLDIGQFPARPQYGLTAPYPLTLYRVILPDLKWRISPFCRDNLLYNFYKQWCDLSVKTALTKSLIQKFESESAQEVRGQSIKPEHVKFHSNIPASLLQDKWKYNNYKSIETRQLCLSVEKAIENVEKRYIRTREMANTTDDEESTSESELTESKKAKCAL